jgi:hypothetical protein
MSDGGGQTPRAESGLETGNGIPGTGTDDDRLGAPLSHTRVRRGHNGVERTGTVLVSGQY